MADEIEIKIPDIGGATGVDVIEILVKEGDTINKDTSLLTLESDKASMEIPSSHAGVIKSIQLKVGDKVSEGDTILILASEEKGVNDKKDAAAHPVEKKETSSSFSTKLGPTMPSSESTEQVSHEVTVAVPDIGGATNVDVIEVLVKEGDTVSKDTSLITLESDKASMEIPSPKAGIVKSVQVKVGDKVSEGHTILILASEESGSDYSFNAKQEPVPSEEKSMLSSPDLKEFTRETVGQSKTISSSVQTSSDENTPLVSAGPAARRLAREMGVNLADVKGTGRKSRISKEDIILYIKNKLKEKSVSSGLSISAPPAIDFSKFGEIEVKPFNKIKRLTGINVHRAWVTIPHVTQFDEADITELEAFRKAEMGHVSDVKLTISAFVCKVVSKALAVFPQFNASLDSSGENLIYKQYFNIGIAVETPNGLVVPVIKGVDGLSVIDIAKEMARLSAKARDKGLMPTDMNGGCFTISSLGGIGGTAFTPIVNSPEVAILGLSRSSIKPVYCDREFKPRLMLPLSLSYDHRVIDGAEAARFTRFISEHLNDIRRILL